MISLDVVALHDRVAVVFKYRTIEIGCATGSAVIITIIKVNVKAYHLLDISIMVTVALP